MVEISHDPDKRCANHDRINEGGDEAPYYKVPFIFGNGRLVMEWWCGDCVQEDKAFNVEDQELYLGDVEVEEVEERYLDGEHPDDIIDWDSIKIE